ncbi:MAG TPA: sugar ABC transporter ATP-binding protein [Rectinema sp.]|jgi:ribose transport system ATP-binding protein|nr:sugar ABC transporter ATP-binding protein [Spirochaetia bacterium]MDI9427413.1 sugar ABC transporter ATP-binding protein [Spirochaetota bacterium]HOI98585.1 sugar ABC transporter ATP-binding protein [Rectinema sp.]HPD69832.1 sugar ABC transporter ATP-binding protein [Rectinema sp.]
MSDNNLLVELTGITKRFPGVLALDSVDMNIVSGEVHGLVGENGAGKSTLIKILTGAYTHDEGKIIFDGKQLTQLTPSKAIELGIACIYQELDLIPHMTVVENIFLGRELYKTKGLKIIDRKRMLEETESLLKNLKLNFDPTKNTCDLGIGHRQMVEICKAVNSNAKLIIMDEPTSSLSEHETEELFEIIAQLKEKGVTVVYISHRLDEIKRICDRITVLRDGKKVADLNINDASIDNIIHLMVGRDIVNKYPKIKSNRGKEALSVQGLERKGILHNISFKAYTGEILGITGLVGAGRTEMARAIIGADPIDAGVVKIFGEEMNIRSPRDSIKAAIAFLPEDRRNQGLVLIKDVLFNVSLVKLKQYSHRGFLQLKNIHQDVDQLVSELKIRTPSVNTIVAELSGGNQQKVVIAKWLLTKARIFIFDEPTRGIDVGAKVEVYNLINELIKNDAAIIIISSEMDEVMEMADRIIVMHEGEIMGEFAHEEATQEKILYLASGIKISA